MSATWKASLLDVLFDQPGVGHCLVGPDGGVLRANAEWLRTTGLTLADVIGADIADIFPELLEVASGAQRSRRRIEVPPRVQGLGGQERHWEGSTTPVAMEGGIGLLITLREVPGNEPHGMLGRAEVPAPRFPLPSEPRDDDRSRLSVEGALQESESRYQLLFQNMLEGYACCQILYDGDRPVDFVTLDVNDAFERLTGLHDVVGRKASEVIPGFGETEPGLLEAFARVARSRRPEQFETYFRPLGKWFSVSAYSPQAGHFVMVFDNVTERKRAEEELQKRQRLFDGVTRATDVMLVFLDPDFNFIWVNDAYAAGSNRRPVELIGMNHFALYPHPENEAIFRRVRDSGEPVFFKDKPFEYPDQPERGITYWDWSLVPTKNWCGEIQGLVFSLRETTKFKQAELALAESEARYAAIFDKSPFAISLSRMPDGLIVAANDAFLRLLGCTREEVLRKTLADLGIRDADPRSQTAALLHQPGRESECLHTTRSGARHSLSVTQDWVSIMGERLVLTTLVDVTDRRQAEDALRLATDAVAEANARLLEADRRKDEFLGMLSHELRNPLAPIRNSITILERATPESETAARARSVIRRQTDHLTRLVDDLLDVTRIARGKVELRRERVDLRELVRHAGEDLRSVIESRGVTFRVDLPLGQVWAELDPTRIAQVVGNLLQNAAKFTYGGDSVTLSLRSFQGTAEISVRDTGAGIEDTLLPNIFQAFVQGSRTLARTQGGLGLGLSLVKGITELHGGTVLAESAGKGKGSEFVVRLPLHGPASQRPPVPTAPVRVGGRRVLVVDDNQDAADSLAELVKTLGHVPAVAYDGPSALEKARAFRPDVVLCDIGLPGMSGYEVAKALRTSRDADHVKLVAVTGYVQPTDLQHAHDAGFDRHLAKPPSVDEIERILG